LIDGWLKEDTNWKPYISLASSRILSIGLKEDTNWKPYISYRAFTFGNVEVEGGY